MGTLDIIAGIYQIDLTQKPPIRVDIGRDGLAMLFCALGFKVGAEIGVEQGLYSERLCQLNPGVNLWSIDAWTAYKGYRDHVSQDKLDGFYRAACERLKPYGGEVVKGFSAEVVTRIPDRGLDFVYIDGAHDFYNVAVDICLWSKKVRPGGIVAGHDFKRDKGKDWVCHVKDVVQAYAYAYGIRPWFVTTLDKSNSWFWVKP